MIYSFYVKSYVGGFNSGRFFIEIINSFFLFVIFYMLRLSIYFFVGWIVFKMIFCLYGFL